VAFREGLCGMTVNPYQSPNTTTARAKQADWFPFDIGVFVGRYLYVLAWLSVASMIVGVLVFDRWQFDLSFIFMLWAGRYLTKHSSTARRWTIGISGLFLFVCLAMTLVAVVFGTGGMTISVGHRITDPPLWAVFCVTAAMAMIAGIPFALLMTGQAKREFARGALNSTTNNAREAQP